MAWVQVGARKINTAQICYIDQIDENLVVYFHSEWAGNPLEIKGEEATAFWRFLKAENATAAKDKGSTMVVPKRVTAPMPVMVDANAKPSEEKPKAPSSPAPLSGQHGSSSHRPASQHSSSHSARPAEAKKH